MQRLGNGKDDIKMKERRPLHWRRAGEKKQEVANWYTVLSQHCWLLQCSSSWGWLHTSHTIVTLLSYCCMYHYCDNLSFWFLALSLISGPKRHTLMVIVLCPMTMGTWSPTKSAVVTTEQESDKSVAIVYPRCNQSVTYAPWSVKRVVRRMWQQYDNSMTLWQ